MPTLAILLSGAYGGVQLYIPNEIHKSHKIALLFAAGGVGYSPCMTLSQLYGGQTITIPELSAYEELRRMSLALYMESQGCSLKEIAVAIKVSQATAKNKIEIAKKVGITARKIRAKKRLKGTVIQHLDNQFNPQQQSLGI